MMLLKKSLSRDPQEIAAENFICRSLQCHKGKSIKFFFFRFREYFFYKSEAAADACGRPLSDRNSCNVYLRGCFAVRNAFDSTHLISLALSPKVPPFTLRFLKMSDVLIYPTLTTQYYVIGSSLKICSEKNGIRPNTNSSNS